MTEAKQDSSEDIQNASESAKPDPSVHDEQNPWGMWLFRASIVISLIFMWWLVIYDHGVVTQH